jgi:GNAT superfamily N-acetyltransferase
MDRDERGYEISTDKERLDLGMIHDFLANESYWAKGIPFEVMRKSIEHSLCFGVYHRDRQVGFARVVTDRATIAYVGDVFIVESCRGRGLGKRLVKAVVDHPELAGLRLWFLGTRDAHGLYEKYGFRKVKETAAVERVMMILNPDIYTKAGGDHPGRRTGGRTEG